MTSIAIASVIAIALLLVHSRFDTVGSGGYTFGIGAMAGISTICWMLSPVKTVIRSGLMKDIGRLNPALAKRLEPVLPVVSLWPVFAMLGILHAVLVKIDYNVWQAESLTRGQPLQITWLVVGLGFGIGSSLWINHFLVK